MSDHDHSPSHHVVSPMIYVAIVAALFALTGITVWVAFVHIGPPGSPWNDVVAITIAVTKATLVVLFFMHVKYSTRMTRLTVIAAGFWLILLLAITASDYVSRGWMDVAGK